MTGPMKRDSDPCWNFRPAIPYRAADQLCRCGWPRTIWTHGQPPQRVLSLEFMQGFIDEVRAGRR